jgi:hypothetical protein
MAEDMAKKRKKIAARKRWSINPKTRVKESGRIYKRSRGKRYIYDAEEAKT